MLLSCLLLLSLLGLLFLVHTISPNWLTANTNPNPNVLANPNPNSDLLVHSACLLFGRNVVRG